MVGRAFPAFLGGLVLVGMARSAVDLGRFAAAEVHLPADRGRAIATVVLGSTVGAIVGPLLVGPTGRLAVAAGGPELAGPYGVGLIGLVFAALLIFGGLRPEPRDVGRELARLHPESVPSQTTRSLREIVGQPGVIVATGSMVFAQVVMMVPMSITSVHMKAHQHPLTAVSMVISAHTLGMFAFSLLSGRLTDRWGRGPVIILGAATMILYYPASWAGPRRGSGRCSPPCSSWASAGTSPTWPPRPSWPTSSPPPSGPRRRASTTSCSTSPQPEARSAAA